MSHEAAPVGGNLLTRPFKWLLGIFAVSVVLLAWRFAAGIGAVTALSDGYPWGLWIAFDVVTGTALACGGYAVAILTYVLNKGQYHPLVRPAVLTSALGYSVAAVAIIIDVGRPWFIYRIPIRVGQWNLNSALLEVALCVMAYVFVLWIELSPAFMERWCEGHGWLSAASRKVLPVFNKVAIWIIALGMLLPTMHQSSLGTVMLLTGHKLHGLWHTPLIPLLFLISCIAMGYAVVVFESTLSSVVFKRQRETKMLASLSGAMIVVLLLYAGIRIVDLLVRGRLALMFLGLYGLLFWIEMACFLVPVAMLWSRERRNDAAHLFRTAMLIMFAGSLYRFDTYLVAFRPGGQWGYFPSVPEMLVTLGVVAVEIMAYIYLVKRFPILGGATPAAVQK